MRRQYLGLDGQYLRCVKTGKDGKCQKYIPLCLEPGDKCLTKSPPHPKKAKKARKTVAGNRDPWRMTKDEWMKAKGEAHPGYVREKFTYQSAARGVRQLEERIRLNDDIGVWDATNGGFRTSHKMIVGKAIAQGKSVPKRVLADYPDMAQFVERDMPGVMSDYAEIKARLQKHQKEKEAETKRHYQRNMGKNREKLIAYMESLAAKSIRPKRLGAFKAVYGYMPITTDQWKWLDEVIKSAGHKKLHTMYNKIKKEADARKAGSLSGLKLTCAEWKAHKGRHGEYIRCTKMLPTCAPAECAPAGSDTKLWIMKHPFTEKEVTAYNRYTHFDADPNQGFETWVGGYGEMIRARMKEQSVKKAPATTAALEAYAKASYDYIKTEIKARNYAPPSYVVGPAKYRTDRIRKADAWRTAADKKVDIARKKLDRAIKAIKATETKPEGAVDLETIAPLTKWRAWEKRKPPEIVNPGTAFSKAQAYLVTDRSLRKSREQGWDYRIVQGAPLRFRDVRMPELIFHKSTRTPGTWDVSDVATGQTITAQGNTFNDQEKAITDLTDWIQASGAKAVRGLIREGATKTRRRGITAYPHIDPIIRDLIEASANKPQNAIIVGVDKPVEKVKNFSGAPMTEMPWMITGSAASALALPMIFREGRR